MSVAFIPGAWTSPPLLANGKEYEQLSGVISVIKREPRWADGTEVGKTLVRDKDLAAKDGQDREKEMGSIGRDWV